MLGLALHGVVIHGEYLLVIVLPGDGVRYLVDVYQFVDQHQHPGVAPLTPEEMLILVEKLAGIHAELYEYAQC